MKGENKLNRYSNGIQRLINRERMLSNDSAEGIVYFNSFMYLENNLIIKKPKRASDTGLIHEYFVGMNLNLLRKQIPNFMYVYTIFRCNSPQNVKNICDSNEILLITEKINGDNIKSIIEKGKMTEYTFYNTIIQVCLSLQMAYDKYRFIHKDLHAGNIMIEKSRKDKVYIKYNISGINEPIYILTDFYAKVIDYGYSYMSINNETYTVVPAFYPRSDFNMDQYNMTGSNPAYIGIDLYKLLGFMKFYFQYYRIPRDLSDKFNLIIKNTYKKLGISDDLISYIGNIKSYCIPPRMDDKLLNLQPYEFFEAFYQLMPNKYKAIVTNNPMKGYNIIGENSNSETVEQIIQNITTINDDNVSDKCKGESWKKLKREWINKDGQLMNNYVCGKKRKSKSSGYNMIAFPKDTSIYGSTLLSNKNFYFPNKYDNKYTGLTIDERDKSRLTNNINGMLYFYNKLPNNIIEYFGDELYAKNNCTNTDNCLLAYKLKVVSEFIDMNDIENIYKIYNKFKSDRSFFNNTIRTIFDKQPATDSNGNIIPPNRDAVDIFNQYLINILDNQQSSSLIIIYKIIEELVYKYNYNYSGICLYTNATGLRFVFGKTVLEYVQRDFNNKLDWQYFDNSRLFGEIGKLIKNMKLYRTYNIIDNQGDPYEKSVWTALYIQEQFKNRTEWVDNINIAYYQLCIISGFLNNIGNLGDKQYLFYEKPEKSKTGYEYITQMKNYSLENGYLNIPQLLQDCNMPMVYQKYIACIVLVSNLFYNTIQQYHDTYDTKQKENIILRYIYDIFTNEEINNDMNDEDLIKLMPIIMLVSIADIMSGTVYTNTNFKMIDEYPYITNQPRKYLSDKSTESYIINDGLSIRRYVMNIIRDPLIVQQLINSMSQ